MISSVVVVARGTGAAPGGLHPSFAFGFPRLPASPIASGAVVPEAPRGSTVDAPTKRPQRAWIGYVLVTVGALLARESLTGEELAAIAARHGAPPRLAGDARQAS